MNFKELLNLTGVPVFIASLCCLAPVVLVLFGLSTVSFAASLSNILDGQYRWAFTLTGLIALIVSLLFYFRKRGICTLDQAIKRRNEVINKILLVLAAAVIGYILFFFIFLTYVGRMLQIWE